MKRKEYTMDVKTLKRMRKFGDKSMKLLNKMLARIKYLEEVIELFQKHADISCALLEEARPLLEKKHGMKLDKVEKLPRGKF